MPWERKIEVNEVTPLPPEVLARREAKKNKLGKWLPFKKGSNPWTQKAKSPPDATSGLGDTSAAAAQVQQGAAEQQTLGLGPSMMQCLPALPGMDPNSGTATSPMLVSSVLLGAPNQVPGLVSFWMTTALPGTPGVSEASGLPGNPLAPGVLSSVGTPDVVGSASGVSMPPALPGAPGVAGDPIMWFQSMPAASLPAAQWVPAGGHPTAVAPAALDAESASTFCPSPTHSTSSRGSVGSQGQSSSKQHRYPRHNIAPLKPLHPRSSRASISETAAAATLPSQAWDTAPTETAAAATVEASRSESGRSSAKTLPCESTNSLEGGPSYPRSARSLSSSGCTLEAPGQDGSNETPSHSLASPATPRSKRRNLFTTRESRTLSFSSSQGTRAVHRGPLSELTATSVSQKNFKLEEDEDQQSNCGQSVDFGSPISIQYFDSQEYGNGNCPEVLSATTGQANLEAPLKLGVSQSKAVKGSLDSQEGLKGQLPTAGIFLGSDKELSQQLALQLQVSGPNS